MVFRIPEGTIKIDANQYAGNDEITLLIFPDSLVEIGYGAFKDCPKIEGITWGAGISEIGDMAFMGCPSLKELNMPSTVKRIGYAAFMDCKSLTYIEFEDSDYIDINGSAFRNCPSLTCAILPNGLKKIGQDSINMLQPYVREHGVSFDNIVFHKLSPDRLLMVSKDSFQIVFYNLLINAIKYAKPNSELSIDISAEESYGNLFVRIQDYGIGIKLEDLNNVFLYGYRSPSAKRISAVGNGFGLYVAKQILQTHDCKISITNNDNPTTFEIEIPNSLFATDINNKESNKPKTILWLDDNIESSVLRPYIDEFHENGVTIVKAKNPDDLSHITDSDWSSLSAIILDVIMPTGDKIDIYQSSGGFKTGFIVLQNLLNDKKLNNVPKIVFSVVDDMEIIEFCKNNRIPVLKKQDYMFDTFIKKVIDIISNYRRE